MMILMKCVWSRCQVDSENVPRPLSASGPHNALTQLRSTISRRIPFRRSVRSSATAGMLPLPDSAAHDDDDDDDADNNDSRDQYISLQQQINRQRNADSLESNRTDAIAARYADHQVPKPPTVSADNRGDSGNRFATSSSGDGASNLTRPPTVSAQNEAGTTRPVSDGTDVSLPVTAAPSVPHTGPPARLMTSISTTGSVGGASATGVDADYLAVTVDEQKSSVS